MFQESLEIFRAAHVTQDTVNQHRDRLNDLERTDLTPRAGPISLQLDKMYNGLSIIQSKLLVVHLSKV